MHQTTIRFGADTWARIEQAARATGVSAAQFVREATIARLASTGGAFGQAAGQAGDVPRAGSARAGALDAREGSHAVWAQARLARVHAHEVREEARALQRGRAQRTGPNVAGR